MVDTSSNEQKSYLYKTNPNFLLRQIGDEYVLIPLGEVGMLNNSVISLNETSQFLWQIFNTPTSIEEAISKTKEEYEAPNDVIEKEIKSFVEAYLEVGLLVKED